MKILSKLDRQKALVESLFDQTEIHPGCYRKGGWTGKEEMIIFKETLPPSCIGGRIWFEVL